MSSSDARGGLAVTVLLATAIWVGGYLVFAVVVGMVAVAAVDLLVEADAASRDAAVAVVVGLGMVGCTALAAAVARRRGQLRPWWLLLLPLGLGVWGLVAAQVSDGPVWAAALALALAVAGSVAIIVRRSPPSGRSPRSARPSRASRRSG
jgi:hypothetical protein